MTIRTWPTWQKVLLVVTVVVLIIFITGMIHFPGGFHVSPPVRG